jgi:hypothetical protein
MRIPDPGPFGDTFFDASARAIAGALFLNNPAGGYVDAVFTLPDHRLPLFALGLARFAISPSAKPLLSIHALPRPHRNPRNPPICESRGSSWSAALSRLLCPGVLCREAWQASVALCAAAEFDFSFQRTVPARHLLRRQSGER